MPIYTSCGSGPETACCGKSVLLEWTVAVYIQISFAQGVMACAIGPEFGPHCDSSISLHLDVVCYTVTPEKQPWVSHPLCFSWSPYKNMAKNAYSGNDHLIGNCCDYCLLCWSVLSHINLCAPHMACSLSSYTQVARAGTIPLYVCTFPSTMGLGSLDCTATQLIIIRAWIAKPNTLLHPAFHALATK